MPALRIYLPYEAVPVRVQLGYGETVSRVEATVLRGIVELWTAQQGPASRGVSLNRLSQLFALDDRMTLHLVFDLWRRDYVTLDMYGAEVAPTPVVLNAFAQGKESELSGGEFTLETLDVWLDRVGGHLTGRSGAGYVPDRELAVPASPLFTATVDDLSGSDLVRAVRETLAERARGADAAQPADRPRGRNLRVLEARLLPAHQLSGAKRTMWFPVDITVRQDPESGAVRVTVVQDSRRSLAHCERIGRLLTEFLERRPEHRFSKRLKKSSENRLADPPSLERTLVRLDTLAGQALTAAAGTREALHESLVEALRTARSQVGARVDGEAEVRLVGAHKDYRDALREVIAAAERQVVLVTSTVHSEGLSDLLPALRAAVERGVQIVLLWGRGHSDTLEARAANALEELRYAAEAHNPEARNTTWREDPTADPGDDTPPGPDGVTAVPPDGGKAEEPGKAAVLVARRPANVNANMVVADNHTALVGGYAYLGRLDRNARQLGALVTAAEQGCGSEPVEAILRWVRRAMPDAATASAVYFRERDFGRRPDDWKLPSQRLAWSELPSPLEQDTGASDTAVRSWALAWRTCAEEVRRHLEARALPSVTLVEDSAHRDALWEAVRSATAQIVLASEYIAHTVVKQPLLALLEERVHAGIRADVLYRHVRKDGADARELLEKAQAAFPGFGLHRGDSAARALVRDDDLVVGSFDFLSHEGAFGGRPGRRPAAEVSLRVTGGGLAQQAAALLGAATVHLPRRRTRPARPGPSGLRSHRLLTELERRTGQRQRVALVRSAVEAGDPTALLSELREAEAPNDLLRLAVAAALRGRLATADPGLLQWADWLVTDLCAHGRFVEAWVLRRALPQGTLPLPLAAAAAARDTVHVGGLLETAALEESPPPGHTAALIALGAAQLLAWSGQGAVPAELPLRLRETLGYLVTDGNPAPCWAELAELARKCPAGIIEHPGPAVIARRQLVRRHRELRLGDAWDAADEALSTAEATNFRFEAGLKTHEYLFHAQGLFGALRPAVDRRDLSAAALWATRQEVADLPGHLDRTTGELMKGHKNKIIHSDKRRVYLNRLHQVKRAVDAVAAFHDAENDADAAYEVTEALPTALRLAAVWPELQGDLDAHPAPVRHLTQHALTTLKDIREWGSGERDAHE
jgi:hypothetical protein